MHEPARIGCKPPIDLLETLPGSLYNEQIDQRDETRIQHRVDEIQAPFEVMDPNRRGLHDQVVEEPITRCCQCSTLGAKFERVHLGRVEPGRGVPAETEGDEVEGDEDGGDDAGDVSAILVADLCGGRDAEESERLRGRHVHEDRAAAEALDEEQGTGRGAHEGDAVGGREEAGGEFGEADGLGEDEREVVAEDVDAGELLSAETQC